MVKLGLTLFTATERSLLGTSRGLEVVAGERNQIRLVADATDNQISVEKFRKEVWVLEGRSGKHAGRRGNDE